MRMELVARFDYGSIVPWVSRQEDGRLQFIAGPNRLLLDTAISTRGEDFRTLAEFTVAAGREVSFVLSWSPSFRASPARLSAAERCGRSNPSIRPDRYAARKTPAFERPLEPEFLDRTRRSGAPDGNTPGGKRRRRSEKSR